MRSADIALGRHAVLVGPNNSGKTTIVEALALLFGRNRLVRRLTEHDFHGSAPDEAAHPVHRHGDGLHAQRPRITIPLGSAPNAQAGLNLAGASRGCG